VRKPADGVRNRAGQVLRCDPVCLPMAWRLGVPPRDESRIRTAEVCLRRGWMPWGKQTRQIQATAIRPPGGGLATQDGQS